MKAILDAKGSLVVYLAGQPLNASGDALTFDWTVVNEFEKLRAHYVPSQQLKNYYI